MRGRSDVKGTVAVVDQELERRNDAVRAEHKAAVARGENRLLRRTVTGALHSYASDEIGVNPSNNQQVKTWWGMAIVAAFLWLLFLGSWLLLFSPLSQGDGPAWGALFPIVLGGLGGWYALRLSRAEYRAAKVRKQRGVPEPGRV